MCRRAFACMALSMTLAMSGGIVRAQEELAGRSDYLLSSQAFKDYMLQCAGCHRFDGQGMPGRGVPDFRNSIGLFTRLGAGREYMIRVPGSSQSQLDNADLARVLNWIVAMYSPEDINQAYRPFTSAEVGASRGRPYDDVVQARKALTEELRKQGLEPAAYTFGSITD